MDVTIDGARIFYLPVGSPERYPLIVLHGGPGLDHTEMHPWMDALADTFYLIYVDQRGQGRSERVDPATLTLGRFAEDVTKLASALGFDRYAVLGHSFGSFVALAHAIEQSCATNYLLSGCTASFSKTMPEIQANLAAFEPAELRDDVTRSWALEPSVRTQEEFAELMRLQMPFHFATTTGDAYQRYLASEHNTVYSPEVLAYFSEHEYAIEYEDRLREIATPCLIMTGQYDRTCTPRAARELHAGIPDSELVIFPDAGHQTYMEQPGMYFAAVRDFFARHGQRD
jgi:proline-specific peptidase